LAQLEKELAEADALYVEAKANKDAEETLEKAERDRLQAERDRILADHLASQATQSETQVPTQDQLTEPLAEQQTPEPPTAEPPSSEDATATASKIGSAGSAFPYPAEYAAPPAADQSESSAPASEAAAEGSSFPYPAEYAAPPAQQTDETPAPSDLSPPAEQPQDIPLPSGSDSDFDDADNHGDANVPPTLPPDNYASPAPMPSFLAWLLKPFVRTVEAFSLVYDTIRITLFPSETHHHGFDSEFSYSSFSDPPSSSWWSYLRDLFPFSVGHDEPSPYPATSFSSPSPAPSYYTSPAAEEARRLLREREDAKSSIQRKIDELKALTTTDFGPESELMELYDKCFEFKHNQYVYEFCGFKEAKQKEGGRSTSLGRFEKYDADQKALRYANGQTCWNGPARSLSVMLECGADNVILGVDEPGKCVYTMRFATPAVCSPQDAAALKQKLQSDFPPLHTEL